jgi:hypothetical protein
MSKLAACWWRVSTDEQNERHSPETQRASNEAVATRHGFTPVHVGGAESAMSTKPRPKFTALLRDVLAGRFAALIVVSEDRLYRNVAHQEQLWAALKLAKCDLFVNGERQNLRDSASQLVATFRAKAGNLEQGARHDSSVRARIGQAAMGFASSGNAPFGRSVVATLVGTKRVWATDSNGEAVWKVDDDAQRYVEKAATLYLSGKSWELVADEMNWPADKPTSRGMKANTVRRRVLEAGSTWDQHFTLRDNLPEDFTSFRHAERIRFEGDEAIVATPVKPLLDEATLAGVRAKSSDRYFARASGRTHALSRLLRCGNCGSSLTIRYHKDDDSIRVAHHPKTLEEGCSTSFLRYEPIELSVLGWLSDMLKDEAQVEAAVRQALAAQVPDADALREELVAVQRERKKADVALAAARANMLAVVLDQDEAAAMTVTFATLKATIARTTERTASIEQRLRDAEVQPEHEAAITATLTKFRRGASLIQSPLAQQREAMTVLFGSGSLRNRPENTKEGSPAMGIFLRWVQDRKTGERYIQWRALGQFFFLDGAVSWDEKNIFGDARQHAWNPSTEQLAGVTGSLKVHALQRAGRPRSV